ncbi:hypothetical protein AB0F17_57020 [Nonomuraea sp. NPDC026600]|uniref:hypothetical protein n=1 Tax=Nonomuraea sp. NPDC026600 TaxID=3155363 RepID=UPI0033C72BEC
MSVHDGPVRIDLDPTPVVGGTYKFWSPDHRLDRTTFVSDYRPEKVNAPLNAPREVIDGWTAAQARAAADARPWYVEHKCGKTSAEIVEALRKRKAVSRRSAPVSEGAP